VWFVKRDIITVETSRTDVRQNDVAEGLKGRTTGRVKRRKGPSQDQDQDRENQWMKKVGRLISEDLVSYDY
jgi:hypothetical protein